MLPAFIRSKPSMKSLKIGLFIANESCIKSKIINLISYAGSLKSGRICMRAYTNDGPAPVSSVR